MNKEKKRDSERTKQKILAVAAQLFTSKGYDAAGMREIAAMAGVNIALINRYFGSKQKLFERAVLAHLSAEPLLADSPAAPAARISAFMLDKARYEGGFDPMVAVLRSAGSAAVRPAIKQLFEHIIVTQLSLGADGNDREKRAALLLALLFGFDSLQRIFGVSQLNDEREKALPVLLTRTIDSILNGAGPAA